jgi:hypothetical protein
MSSRVDVVPRTTQELDTQGDLHHCRLRRPRRVRPNESDYQGRRPPPRRRPGETRRDDENRRDPPPQVRNHDDTEVVAIEGPYLRSELPVAEFAIIEADSLGKAVALVSKAPAPPPRVWSRSGLETERA